MILKAIDPGNATHPMTKAGRMAEEQMAHYLKRAFGDDPQVLVVNGLRLERSGDVAQMDHLLLHRHGFVIVESKSISGEVRVNAQGEWARRTGTQVQGMASPVLQAQRQAAFLIRYLQDTPHLLEQHDGSEWSQDVLVAISDMGIIHRSVHQPLTEVCKADQVPDKAKAIMALRVKESGPAISWAGLLRLGAFLLEQHRPSHARQPAGEKTPASVKPVAQTKPIQAAPVHATCKHCSSPRVNIMYGKFGYYFKCGACDGNTAIQMTCPSCKAKAKVRKDKEKFFFECSACGVNTLFFVNVSDLQEMHAG